VTAAGQTTAEFAVVVTILLLFIFGIIDLSRAVYARNVIANAAREGARYAVAHPPEDSAGFERVKQPARALLVGLEPEHLAVDVTRPGGTSIQVTVSYTFHPVIGWIGRIIDRSGAGIPMRSRCIMATVTEE
jgi:Flp pilus assembly protein TadG